MEQIPIPKPTASENKLFRAKADKMLALQSSYHLGGQKDPTLKSKIDDLDKEINHLVYKLYKLTEEEIAIVEGS